MYGAAGVAAFCDFRRRDGRVIGRGAGGVAALRCGRAGQQRAQCLAVGVDQQLDRRAHALAERLGEIRLPLARVAHRLQQRRRRSLGGRRPCPGIEKNAEGGDLGGQLALVEPEVEVPLAPGVVVEAGEQQPPLAAVGDERQLLAAGAQPAERQADRAAPAADAEAPFAVQEHRQHGAAAPAPEVVRLDELTGDGAPSPGGGDAAAAGPGPGRLIQAAHPLQDEGGEARAVAAPAAFGVPAAGEEGGGALAELAGGVGVERGRGEGRQLRQARAVEQQAAVVEALPAGQDGGRRGGALVALHAARSGRPGRPARPGRRISTATGKTRAAPAMANRLGSTWSRMRPRSSCNWARISW